MLEKFLTKAAADPRLGPGHICLYIAILSESFKQDCTQPVILFGKDLMRQAKIGTVTYHKFIAQLANYGFVRYIPSHNPAKGSKFYLL